MPSDQKKNEMKKILQLAAFAAALLLTGSCLKDPGYIVLNEQTTGDLIEGRFLSDQGLWYDIAEQTCEGRLADCERAIIICDILRESTKNEPAYDIRLKKFVSVGLPEVVKTTEGEQEDPVLVDLSWVSGRYLNLRVIYHTVAKSTANHSFKVALVKKPSGTEPLVVRVLHDADGEYLGADNIKEEDLQQAVAFISIPIVEYYEDLKDYTIYYEVEYLWHKTGDDGNLLPETENDTLNGKLYS